MTDETQGTALAEYRATKADLVTGSEVAPIIPRTADEVFRLANALHKSGLAPSTLSSPEKITVAIMAGAELGLPPFQSLQSFAVINGRPSLWGDGFLAVVRSKGFKVREWPEGEGDTLTAFCEVIRPDNGEVITRSFSVEDARKANLWNKTGPWQTNPKRMLQMRARGFACRDGAADVLRGFQIAEEASDYTSPAPSAPQPAGLKHRLQDRASVPTAGLASAKVEEAIAEASPADEVVVEADYAKPEAIDWTKYEADFKAELDAGNHPTEAALLHDWNEVVERMVRYGAPEDMRARLTTAVLERRKALAPKRKAANAA